MSRVARYWATEKSNNIIGRRGGDTPAGRIGAVGMALQTSIGEKSPGRRFDPSHSGSSAAGRQHGESFRLGQPEGLRSELFRDETQAHRLVCMGPRQKKGGHRFDPAMHQLLEIKTKAQWVFLRLKAGTNASSNPETRMQSLSLRTAFLKSISLKTAVGEILSTMPGQRELRWSNKKGQELQCRKQSCSSRHPKRRLGLSSAE